jgi:tetratricopeptide (TPR) repeat protein
VAIEGPLKELGLHDVFQLLDLSRKTGVLRVTSPLRRNQGTVYFDRGAIVGAEVRSNPHPLGEQLVRAGRLTETELAMVRELQREGDRRRLGEILVEMGALTQRDLERQVRQQIEEVVFEVVSWREGYFSFAEGPLADLRTDADVRIPTEAVLMEGARRIDEWSRIERHIPHLGVVPALASVADDAHGALDLLPSEWELLALIDGERDLRAIAGALGRSEFEVAKIVFGLATSRVITLRDPQVGRTPEAGPGLGEQMAHVETLIASGDLEAARLEAEALATAFSAEATAHALAARVTLAAGRFRDAEAAARRALALEPLLPEGHRIVGDALVAQGRLAEAAEWLDRWLAIDRRRGAPEAGAREEVTAAIAAARALETYLRGRRG